MAKSWIAGGVVAFLFATVLLLPAVAFAGGTGAGTVITADGKADYTGGTVNSGTALTTVDAAYGVQITSTPSDDSGDAGTEVAYSFTIKNIGNTTDTLHFTISGATWPATLSAETASVGNDASTTVTVTIGILAAAGNGDTDSFALVIKDNDGDGSNDNWPTATDDDTVTSATITTTANAPVVTLTLAVDKDHEKPYADLTYTADYSNGGGANADSLVLTFNIALETKYIKGSAKPNTTHTGGAVTIWYHDGSWSTTEPAADGDGCCPNVTMIRFTYTGTVAPTDGGQVEYKARIK